MANAGVLLIASTLEGMGIAVDTLQVSKIALPVAIISFIVWAAQNVLFDRKMNRLYSSKGNNKARGDQ